MMLTTAELKEKLSAFLTEEQMLQDAPMKNHVSFRAGGAAALLLLPKSSAELRSALQTCKAAGWPVFVMGNGSNLLVTDAGYPGAIIKIGSTMGRCRVGGDSEWAAPGAPAVPAGASDCLPAGTIRAEAGILLSTLAARALDAGLTGLEFASGIPGSLGGGLFMNAGAYGGELKDIVTWVRVMDPETGEEKVLSGEEMAFGYRTSRLQKTGEIVLEAQLQLQPGDKEAISARMKELTAQRVAKQPLQYPSAGSFFKRPEGHFAGALIEQAGLKGLALGGARISPLQAGFMVNEGGATATEIIQLMHVAQAVVFEMFGVKLEPEVRFLGALPGENAAAVLSAEAVPGGAR